MFINITKLILNLKKNYDSWSFNLNKQKLSLAGRANFDIQKFIPKLGINLIAVVAVAGLMLAGNSKTFATPPAGCAGGPAGTPAPGSCETYEAILANLASQVCKAPTTGSADSKEKTLANCKKNLSNDAESIYKTCSSQTTDLLKCIATETTKTQQRTTSTGQNITVGDNELHTADGSNAGKLYAYIIIGVKVLGAVGGVAIVLSIIGAGIKYATAGGDSGAISKAKSRIVYTLLALILYLMLFSIVTWLIPSDVV
jgi:hypothetical protein